MVIRTLKIGMHRDASVSGILATVEHRAARWDKVVRCWRKCDTAWAAVSFAGFDVGFGNVNLKFLKLAYPFWIYRIVGLVA